MDGSNKRKQVWENIFLFQTLETNEAQEIRQKLTSGNWIAFGVREGDPFTLLLGQIWPEGNKPVVTLESEDMWYMTVALQMYFADRKEEKAARKIVMLLRKLFDLKVPQSGGGVGMIEGWLEAIQDKVKGAS